MVKVSADNLLAMKSMSHCLVSKCLLCEADQRYDVQLEELTTWRHQDQAMTDIEIIGLPLCLKLPPFSLFSFMFVLFFLFVFLSWPIRSP